MLKIMHPNRTFNGLIGASAVLVVLLTVAIFRVLLAGCPEGWNEAGLACLFTPTHTDLGIHLLSYILGGAAIVGMTLGFTFWHRQQRKTHRLCADLEIGRLADSDIAIISRRLGLEGKVYLVDTEPAFSFCAGLISPCIYLSRKTVEKLTTEELEALLLHEKHHLEHRDPLRILLGRLVVSILFFIPVLQDVLRRYLVEIELAADQNAIQHQGDRRGIAGALHKLIQESVAMPVAGFTVGAADALEYRIAYLAGHAPRYGHSISLHRLVSSLLVVLLFIAVVLVPLQASHPITL